MEIDKELEKQLNDDRIHKYWKKPRTARDLAGWLLIIGMGLGILLGILVFDAVFDVFEKMNEKQIDYKEMILDYSDCHSKRLILANENLDWQFQQRLLAQWTVSCSDE